MSPLFIQWTEREKRKTIPLKHKGSIWKKIKITIRGVIGGQTHWVHARITLVFLYYGSSISEVPRPKIDINTFKRYQLTLLEDCVRRKSTRNWSPPIFFPFMFFIASKASSSFKYSTYAIFRSLRNLKSSILPNLRNSSSSRSSETDELIPPTHRYLLGLAWKREGGLRIEKEEAQVTHVLVGKKMPVLPLSE